MATRLESGGAHDPNGVDEGKPAGVVRSCGERQIHRSRRRLCSRPLIASVHRNLTTSGDLDLIPCRREVGAPVDDNTGSNGAIAGLNPRAVQKQLRSARSCGLRRLRNSVAKLRYALFHGLLEP